MRNTVLWQLRVEKNRQSFDYFDYWCDYLILSFKDRLDYFDDLLFWVDTDNSNFWIINEIWYEITYSKRLTPLWYGLDFSYSYNWVSIPIMQYVKFNSYTKINTKKNWKISIYWSYFRLEEIWEFYDRFLLKFIKKYSKEDPIITRYDMRFDYFSLNNYVNIPSINDICWYVHSKSLIQEWKEWNKLIDWSVWNSETWRYRVRYYDKKIDTDKKNKRVLYSDFMKYKSVHRLEIEFLRSFTRWYTLSNIVDLENKIFGVLWLEWKTWDCSQFYQYDSSKEINDENRWWYFNRYITATKKLIKAWYNPYQLIEEAIIWEFGKDKSLWLLEDFINQSLSYERH